MIEIKFLMEEGVADQLDYFQQHPRIDNKAMNKVKKLSRSEFCKLLVEMYVANSMKERGMVNF